MGMSRSNNIVGGIITLCVLGGIAVVLWYFLGKPENPDELATAVGNISWPDLDDFQNVLDSLEGLSWGDLYNRDPYVGDNTTSSWGSSMIDRSGGGLYLTLYNALDDTWQDEFEYAVGQWQESPALTLSTEQVAVDYTCQPVDGVLVVCNANFGKTGWVGICENSMMGGIIVAAVAKMNEYYLRNADWEERQYTMCHEIGHGFGLPHTDEIFSNKPQGNCLDYTDQPEKNQEPGDVNFAKLNTLYLSQTKRRLGSDGRVVETTTLVYQGDDLDE